MADAQVGQFDLVEPVGQCRPQHEALVRGVGFEAEEGAEEVDDRSRGPGLRDVGPQVLNRKRAFVARKTAIDLGQSPILESAGGIE